MAPIRAGITIGDINGIGLEVIIKTLSHPSITNLMTPVIYGSTKIVSYHKNIVQPEDFSFQSASGADRISQNKINIINCWSDTVNINLGKETEEGGHYAKLALDKAVQDLRDGHIDILVTAPINKTSMQMAGFQHAGHTEYLAHQFNSSSPMMMMIADNMRIALATTHLPIKEVAATLSKDKLKARLDQLTRTLQIDFGISKPVIAVLGLNPHAGENGNIGKEEEEIIRPVIIEAKKSGQLVMGPFPADGFFGSGHHMKYDAVLAMYHDQGLIPFKMLHFDDGVNYTAGLSIIRTSPDHGTAFDLAGKNQADPSSFRAALFSAIEIFKTRRQFYKDSAHSLRKTDKPSEPEGGDPEFPDAEK